MPALLSSLIDASRDDLSAVLAPDGARRPRLRESLAGIPGPRVFTRIDAAALNDAVHGFLAAVPQTAPGDLPEAARHEREQRRAAAQARKPAVPGMRPQAAADG